MTVCMYRIEKKEKESCIHVCCIFSKLCLNYMVKMTMLIMVYKYVYTGLHALYVFYCYVTKLTIFKCSHVRQLPFIDNDIMTKQNIVHGKRCMVL